MSIASEITRLQNAKQDIKEAIENKGVVVGSERLDEYSQLIDVLPAVVELTQAQYDTLSVYDDNTYYLIVEV